MEKYSIIVEEQKVKSIKPVLKDRDTVKLLEEIAKKYYDAEKKFNAFGTNIDVKAIGIELSVQVYIDGKPGPWDRVSIYITKHDEDD